MKTNTLVTVLCLAAPALLLGCNKKGSAPIDTSPPAESCSVEIKGGPAKLTAEISGMESSITSKDGDTTAILADGQVTLQSDEPATIGTIADGTANLVWLDQKRQAYAPARNGLTSLDAKTIGKVNFKTADCNNDQLYLGAIHLTAIAGEIELKMRKGAD